MTTVMGIFALVAAVVLLIEVSRLQRIAAGAAYAEHMVYVTGGVLCLVASVLVGWVAGLVPDVLGADQARLYSDALVGVSMVLLGIYFIRVRRAISRYLDVLNADRTIARAHVEDSGAEERLGG